jgi:tetratricopeptide (TPR) repeat protein/predicted aspartyl protease
VRAVVRCPARSLAFGWRHLLAVALILPSARYLSASDVPCSLGKLLELSVAMEGPRPIASATINGAPVRLIVDSGAFWSSLSTASAARFNLPTKPLPVGFNVVGIGGAMTPRLATVRELGLGSTTFHDMDFVVGGSEPGADVQGVIGQNILGLADVEYDLANGVVRLIHPHDCAKADLAYWASDKQPYAIVELERPRSAFKVTAGPAVINGVQARALFDTGAPFSMVNRKLAEHAGFKADGPGVVQGGWIHGIGPGGISSWIAPFASFRLGDEQINNTRLRVGDMGLGDIDMLIGADFFLSHHLYVANSQRRLYFTYSGGPVFNLTVNPLAPVAGAPVADTGADALDAAGLARRGAAEAARRELDESIADYSHAIDLDSRNGGYFRARAMVYWAKGEKDHARADIDQAISLDPIDTEALLARAHWRSDADDPAGAIRDLDAADRLLPAQSDARFELAMLYGSTDRFEAAVHQLDLWMPLHRQDARYLSALAARCRDRTLGNIQLPLALDDCDEALRHHAVAGTLAVRGFVRLRLGEPAKALKDFSAALQQAPSDAWSLYGRGITEMRLGQGEAGHIDIDAAVAKQPDIAERASRYGFSP